CGRADSAPEAQPARSPSRRAAPPRTSCSGRSRSPPRSACTPTRTSPFWSSNGRADTHTRRRAATPGAGAGGGTAPLAGRAAAQEDRGGAGPLYRGTGGGKEGGRHRGPQPLAARPGAGGDPGRDPVAARSPLPPAAACVPTRRGESGGGRKSSPVRGLLQGGRDVQAPRGRYRGAGAAPPQPREAAPAAEGGEARGARRRGRGSPAEILHARADAAAAGEGGPASQLHGGAH